MSDCLIYIKPSSSSISGPIHSDIVKSAAVEDLASESRYGQSLHLQNDEETWPLNFQMMPIAILPKLLANT